MPQTQATRHETLDRLTLALDSGALVDVRRMLNGLPPAEIAHLLESSPPKFRNILWKMIEVDQEGEVLGELPDDLQAHFLSRMDAAEVATITEGLEDDDIADILQQLPDRVTWEVLNYMDHQDRARLESVMLYPDEVAGGLMNTDTITIRASLTLDVVMRYLRRHEEIPEMTDNLIVVNRSDQFIGVLPLRTLLVSDPSASVREMMLTDIEPIPVDLPDSDVARLFERNDKRAFQLIVQSHRASPQLLICAKETVHSGVMQACDLDQSTTSDASNSAKVKFSTKRCMKTPARWKASRHAGTRVLRSCRPSTPPCSPRCARGSTTTVTRAPP